MQTVARTKTYLAGRSLIPKSTLVHPIRVASVLLFLLSAPLSTHAQIRNPGFETGDGTGWTLSGLKVTLRDTGAHRGSNHIYWDNDGAAYEAACSQSLSGLKDGEYSLIVWRATMPGATFFLEADGDGDGTYEHSTSFRETKGQWTECNLVVAVRGGKLNIRARVESTGGFAAVDDWQLLDEIPLERTPFSSILKAGLPGIEQNQFWRALEEGPKWQGMRLTEDKTEPADSGLTTRRMVYQNSEGLRVTRIFTFYPDYGAVEFRTSYENVGSQDLPPVTPGSDLDLWFPFSAFERLVVHSTGTEATDNVYPVPLWTLKKSYLLKDSGAGMPSNIWTLGKGQEVTDRGVHRPMAFLEDEDSGDGMFMELGWAGYWQITFRWVDFKTLPYVVPESYVHEHGDSLNIVGGPAGMSIALRPGEKITFPELLLQFYSGGVGRGRNQIRRLKLEHFSLPWPKNVPEAPTLYDMFYSSRGFIPKDELWRLADRAAELGMEYYFIGADWVPEMRIWAPYERYSSIEDPWSFPVDRAFFPSGSLRPLSDYVHSKGMKFALWFDTERVYDHWPVAQEHPEWLLGPVLNLGNPDALKWIQTETARAIRNWDVDFYFHDRFGNAEGQWAAHDPPGRQGITQLKFIQGRYALWKWLHEQFPQLVILNPGGHDLGSLRHTHLTMAGRHTGDGNYNRYELSALNWFYPTTRLQNDFFMYKESYTERYALSAWLSRFAAMLGVGDPIGHWSPAVMKQGQEVVQVYKSIRHLLKEDFYPLFPQAQTLETWDGWQYHSPKTGEGFAVVFRLRYCDRPKETVWLKGLSETASYRFSDPFSGEGFTVEGGRLLKQGLDMRLPKNGARLLHYVSQAKNSSD